MRAFIFMFFFLFGKPKIKRELILSLSKIVVVLPLNNNICVVYGLIIINFFFLGVKYYIVDS